MVRLTFEREYAYNIEADGIELPVALSTLNETIELLAKLDTGATNCIFAREVGEALGFHIESGEIRRFSTATGSFTTYGHGVTLRCLGVEVDTEVYFAVDLDFQRNVLGRRGWLEQVRLALIDYERRLFVSPYSKP